MAKPTKSFRDAVKPRGDSSTPSPPPTSTVMRGTPPVGSSGASDAHVLPSFTPADVDLLKCQFPEPIVISSAKFSSSVAVWANSLIGKTLGREVSVDDLNSALSSQWLDLGEWEVFPVGNGFQVFRFQSQEARDSVLYGGPWVVDGAVLALSMFDPSFRPSECQLARAVIWVRLPDLPPSFWSDDVITDILSVVGRVIRLDEYTRLRTRGKFARAAVEIDLRSPLLPGIIVGVEHGEVPPFWQHFQYEHIHVFCSRCRYVGHKAAACMTPSDLGGGDGVGSSSVGSVTQGCTSASFPLPTIPTELASHLMVRRRRTSSVAAVTSPVPVQRGGQARISKQSTGPNLHASPEKSIEVGLNVDTLAVAARDRSSQVTKVPASGSGPVQFRPRPPLSGPTGPSFTLANQPEQLEPLGSPHSSQPLQASDVGMVDGELPISKADTTDESRLIQEIMQDSDVEQDDTYFTLASLKKKKGKGKPKEICLRLEPHKRSATKKVKLGCNFGQFSLLHDLMSDVTAEELAMRHGPLG